MWNYIRKFAVLILCVSPCVSFVSYAKETAEQPRKFNDVLNGLLNDFSYDLKTNQVKGIQNVSIRKVVVNEVIPKSYESYLEDLVMERMRTHSKIKLIQCTNCKLKRSRVEGGRVIISTPINNPAELDGLSRELGIDVWMDVALLYQETNMILAFKAFDAKTKELVWTKVYNSEKLESETAAEEPTVDRDEDGNYISHYVTNVSVGVYSVPNVAENETMIGLGIRIAEQFNDRHSEVGASITPLFSPDLVTSNYSTTKQVDGANANTSDSIKTVKDVEPWTIGAKVAATYHHTFWDGKENYDVVRYGMGAGVGGIIAPGYLTLYGRGSTHARFGKRWQLELGCDYHMPTTISVQNVKFNTEGGVGYDISFGFLF